MTNRFRWAVGIVLKHEGGYVDNPLDPGGETKYGISKRAYPDEDIKNLTKTRAMELYYQDYWSSWLDKFTDPVLSLQVFDFGVNAGVKQAVKIIQGLVGTYEDGILGPSTTEAVNGKNAEWLQKRYSEEIIIFYKDVALRQKNDFAFFRGWIRRALDNLTVDVS